MKKVYLAIIKNKYLKIGLLLLVASGIMAIYLNNEGFNCLSKLSKNGKGSFDDESKAVEEARWYCFFITNSYVYSLFGVLIGAIIIIVWYLKYRNIWQTKFEK
jgi:hypothetical protein